MTNSLYSFVDALRDELEQYGEMLARLDRLDRLNHQTGSHRPDGALPARAEVELQRAVVHHAHELRLKRERVVARELSLTGNATAADLLERLPKNYRPLVAALVGENEELSERVQLRLEQIALAPAAAEATTAVRPARALNGLNFPA